MRHGNRRGRRHHSNAHYGIRTGRTGARPGITDAATLTAEKLESQLDNLFASLVAEDGGHTYYNQKAALKAMPEGWRLPTTSELDYAIKKLNGGDYSTAGKWLRADGFDVDSTSLRLATSGRFNGSVINEGTGYLLTQSTQNAMPLALQFGDEVTVTKQFGYLIPVRGVRPAPSDYTEMLESVGLIDTLANADSADATPPLKYGPLGQQAKLRDWGATIAFDFSGGQWKSGYHEPRSGLLLRKSDPEEFGDLIYWLFHTTRNGSFLSESTNEEPNKYHNALRKMTAMENGLGTQYIVELQWSCNFRLWTNYDYYTQTQTLSEMPDVFSRSPRCVAYISIAGDHSDNYFMKNRIAYNDSHDGFILDLYSYLKPLTNTQLGFQPWNTDPNKRSEARMDYLMRTFQILTADFNGDYIDELVIVIDGDLWVYDGAAIRYAVTTNSITSTYNNDPLYHKTDTEESVDNAVDRATSRVAVGDVNGDGVPDIAILRVANTTTLTVYSAGNLDSEPILSHEFAADPENSMTKDSFFTDLKIGNVSDSPYNDILILSRNYTEADGFHDTYSTLRRAIYDPTQTDSLRFDEPLHIYDGCSAPENGSRFWSGNNNVTLAHFRGRGFPCDVVAGAELLRYNAATGRLEKQFNILPFLTDENQSWTIYPDNIIAADALGDGHDALYYMRSHSDGDKNEAMVLTSIAETKFKNRYVQESDLEHTFDWNSKYLGYCNQGEKWSTTYPDLELMWWYRHNGPEEWGHTAALCASNARYNDSHKTVRYTGFRRAYSEPRIHALIAAPPAYAPEETTSFFTPATHWCYSSDTEQPTTAASSITAGVVTGYEDETNTPLIATKLHNRDFAEAMQYECANALGSPANPSSPTGHYEARNEDIVIMQVTPYDVYTYQIIGAATIDQTDNHFTVSIPSKPVTFAITLSEYERLVADAPSAPDLRQVFRHKVGDPFSYPASNAEIRTNVLRCSVIWGKGQWDNWLTIGTDDISYRDLTLPETYSFATDTELVDAATGIKTDSGYGYGYDANHSATTHTEGQGVTISACVPGLTPAAAAVRPRFDWNICWYKYTLNGQTFPVVNYIVRKH